MTPIFSDVVFPVHDATASGGTIVKWHKTDGTIVAKCEVLVTIETAKVVLELTSESSGKLHIELGEGEEVESGTVVARIDMNAAVTDSTSSTKIYASKERDEKQIGALVSDGLENISPPHAKGSNRSNRSKPKQRKPQSTLPLPAAYHFTEAAGMPPVSIWDTPDIAPLDLAAKIGLPEWPEDANPDQPLVKKPHSQ